MLNDIRNQPDELSHWLSLSIHSELLTLLSLGHNAVWITAYLNFELPQSLGIQYSLVELEHYKGRSKYPDQKALLGFSKLIFIYGVITTST